MSARIPLVALGLFACACGARTELDVTGADGGGADGGPAPRSCRDAPTCIEGDVVTPSAVVWVSDEGTVAALREDVWLEPIPADPDLMLSAQVFRDARLGPTELSLSTSARWFADVSTSEHGCAVFGRGVLERASFESGGVIEGTFEGVTRDCPVRYVVADGWFRMTMP